VRRASQDSRSLVCTPRPRLCIASLTCSRKGPLHVVCACRLSRHTGPTHRAAVVVGGHRARFLPPTTATREKPSRTCTTAEADSFNAAAAGVSFFCTARLPCCAACRGSGWLVDGWWTSHRAWLRNCQMPPKRTHAHLQVGPNTVCNRTYCILQLRDCTRSCEAGGGWKPQAGKTPTHLGTVVQHAAAGGADLHVDDGIVLPLHVCTHAGQASAGGCIQTVASKELPLRQTVRTVAACAAPRGCWLPCQRSQGELTATTVLWPPDGTGLEQGARRVRRVAQQETSLTVGAPLRRRSGTPSQTHCVGRRSAFRAELAGRSLGWRETKQRPRRHSLGTHCLRRCKGWCFRGCWTCGLVAP